MEYILKIGNRTRKLNIDIVPYAAHKINATIEGRKAELVALAEDEALINQRIIELRQAHEDGWFGEARGLRKELRGITAEAKELINKMFFIDRFEMVKLILSKNGIEENDQLMNHKVWEEDMDSFILNDFINQCIHGDKKKEQSTAK